MKKINHVWMVMPRAWGDYEVIWIAREKGVFLTREKCRQWIRDNRYKYISRLSAEKIEINH